MNVLQVVREVANLVLNCNAEEGLVEKVSFWVI